MLGTTEGRFSGHDCVNDGEATASSTTFPKPVEVQRVDFTDTTERLAVSFILLDADMVCASDSFNPLETTAFNIFSAFWSYVYPGGIFPGVSVSLSKYSIVPLPCTVHATLSPFLPTFTSDEHDKLPVDALIRVDFKTSPLSTSKCRTVK